MRFKPKRQPVIFGGPSLSLVNREESSMEFRPPIKFGDLTGLIGSERPVLITDGFFGGDLSVTTVECLDFLKNDGLLLGSSSMGALRAADCAIKGMLGIGKVFQGYVLGHFRSDADVAVKYHRETFDELSISVVHVDEILNYLVKEERISKVTARQIFFDAKVVPWFERNINVVCEIFRRRVHDLTRVEFDQCFSNPHLNPKKSDALMAVNLIERFYLSNRGIL